MMDLSVVRTWRILSGLGVFRSQIFWLGVTVALLLLSAVLIGKYLRFIRKQYYPGDKVDFTPNRTYRKGDKAQLFASGDVKVVQAVAESCAVDNVPDAKPPLRGPDGKFVSRKPKVGNKGSMNG